MIILGLGSNLGDREKNLNSAIDLMAERLLVGIKRSSIIQSTPIVPENSPEDWLDKEYLNMAIGGELKASLTPQEFLKETQKIEKELGRTPSDRWAPRIIDIDILAWGDLVVDEPDLQIPHKELLNRDFALIPLHEIAPEWVHPKLVDKN